MKGLFAYEEYIDLVEKLIQKEDNALADYTHIPIEYLYNHAKQFRKTLNSVQLNKKVYNFLSEFNKHLKWTIITEPWCGDDSFNTPYLIMMANSAEQIHLQIALRDQHEELMNRHLTNGSKTIPILVCTDENDKPLFTWGPRPAACQQMVNTLPHDISIANKIDKIFDWYNIDKGEQVQLEIFELLKTIK
ncbi:MAG: thioredoxin family protein [Bacteroidota bacterium]